MRDVTLKIVGAGFGRTGTKSLKAALERLGFAKCYHMTELRENPAHLPYWQEALKSGSTDWDALFEGYGSCVDWPAAFHWRALTAHYPDAKVLLSVRSPESWVKSIQPTIFTTLRKVSELPPGPLREQRQMNYEMIVERTFEGRLDDDDYLISVFNKNIQDVQATIPAECLLTFDAAEGWGPLCRFLGVDIPDEPFPFTNTTAEFIENVKARAEALKGSS